MKKNINKAKSEIPLEDLTSFGITNAKNDIMNEIAYNDALCCENNLLKEKLNEIVESRTALTSRGILAKDVDIIIQEALDKLCNYRTHFGHLVCFKGEEISVDDFQTLSNKMFELLCILYENELKLTYVNMEPVLANIQTIDIIIIIFKRIYAEVYSDTVSKELLFKFENALCEYFCIDKIM